MALDTVQRETVAQRDAFLAVLDPETPTGLGLSAVDLNEVLIAVADRADVVAPERAASLKRGLAALEREAARVLSL